MQDVASALLTGFAQSLTWPALGGLMLGVIAGSLVGLLPGLSAAAMLAMLVPFTLALDPLPAFALLVGAAAVTGTAGDLSSILLGMPGEPVSAAMVVDGHALAVRGEAGRAVGAALMSSLMGAAIGVVALVAVIPVARPVMLSIGSPELFMLSLAGIALVAPLAVPAPLKGFGAGALGLLLATVGLDPISATPRYTLGSLFLWDGLSILPATLGLFAIPEALALASAGRRPRHQPAGGDAGVWRGAGDAWRHWRACWLGCGLLHCARDFRRGP
jgi:TctA family transporter